MVPETTSDSGLLSRMYASNACTSRFEPLAFPSIAHRIELLSKPRMSRELSSFLRSHEFQSVGCKARGYSSQSEEALHRAKLTWESQNAGRKKLEAMLMYLVAMITAMVGATYAALPLYRKFCQATGYGGTLQRRESLCETPDLYEAYRKQQHRWHSGPMQLFRLALPDIIAAKILWTRKFNMVFFFFLLRKLILPFYYFTLFCIILPLTMFVPEATLPAWVVCYIPALMSLLNVIPSPKSFPFLVPFLLFENTMSVTKFNAMISGLFQLRSSHEWVVTKKSGVKALEGLETSTSKADL